jgi:hypothetical protein
MKIPKYWAKSIQSVQQPGGRPYLLVIWQWSDVSVSEAQQKADDRIRELAQRVGFGEILNRYGYGERPLREEITQGVTNVAGSEVAIVTRNAYGALVLNAANAMFIDVDFADKSASGSGGGGFSWGFGKRAPSQEDQHVERITAWANRNPAVSLRVYRTAAGLRCLITNHTFAPTRSDALDILRAFESDPLYVRLCQAQECFRARLTPKPWRCNIAPPPWRYPWANSDVEINYRVWERHYEQASRSYAVCRLIKEFGPREVHPDVAPILALHDRITSVEDQRPLA